MNKHHSPHNTCLHQRVPCSTHQFCTSKKMLPMQSEWLSVTFLLAHFRLHSLPYQWLFSTHGAVVTNSRDSVAHSRNRELCPSLLDKMVIGDRWWERKIEFDMALKLSEIGGRTISGDWKTKQHVFCSQASNPPNFGSLTHWACLCSNNDGSMPCKLNVNLSKTQGLPWWSLPKLLQLPQNGRVQLQT